MIFFPLSKGNSGIYHSLKTTGQSYWHFNLNRRCCHIHTCVCVCVCACTHMCTHTCVFQNQYQGSIVLIIYQKSWKENTPSLPVVLLELSVVLKFFFTAFLEWNLTSLFFFFFPSLISSLLFYSKSDIKPITIVK